MRIGRLFTLAIPALCIAATIPTVEHVKARSPLVGGSRPHPGAAASVVSIEVDRVRRCGGVLIDAKLVLTSAQCVADVLPHRIMVVAGSGVSCVALYLRSNP